MGSLLSELSLDLKPTFVPTTITDFLKEVSLIGDVKERALKLDDFVRKLEDEMKKIDAFKRELPLCMLLLNDAIQAVKEESVHYSALLNTKPVLEEFIPLRKDSDEDNSATKKEDDTKEKKNWMSSLQLWNADNYAPNDPVCNVKQDSKVGYKRNGSAVEDSFQGFYKKSAGGGFNPFNAYSSALKRKEVKQELPNRGFSLLASGVQVGEQFRSGALKASTGRAIDSAEPMVQSNLQPQFQHPQQQVSKKQRRCWSPDLHRRFVDALQQLGGAQVATPKQIKELMQVDGLTNDEVKSHLQKYRLHTRRLPATATTTANQSAVILGRLWMSQDKFSDSIKVHGSQSGSPEGPLQLSGNHGGTSITGDSTDDDED